MFLKRVLKFQFNALLFLPKIWTKQSKQKPQVFDLHHTWGFLMRRLRDYFMIPGPPILKIQNLSSSRRHFIISFKSLQKQASGDFLEIIKVPFGHLVLCFNAETEGFEPSIHLRVYKLSRLARSTTLTSLLLYP
jgi:hypothetical protein